MTKIRSNVKCYCINLIIYTKLCTSEWTFATVISLSISCSKSKPNYIIRCRLSQICYLQFDGWKWLRKWIGNAAQGNNLPSCTVDYRVRIGPHADKTTTSCPPTQRTIKSATMERALERATRQFVTAVASFINNARRYRRYLAGQVREPSTGEYSGGP